MKKLGFIFFISFAFLVACSNPAPPRVVYFLSHESNDNFQVWRLDWKSSALQQITDEESGVQDFSVSPIDGSLAILTGNQLWLQDADGGNRRLIADGASVDPNIADYQFRAFVSDPVFSPDGNTVAYGFDGIHFYNIATGQDEQVLSNLGNLLDEQFVFAREAYAPGPWSPDGRKLLIVMGYYEGSTLAVMKIDAEQPFTRLRSDGPVCCQFSWSADSGSVLVANPYYTGDKPGLWRFDGDTGEQTLLIPPATDAETINFVGWPFQGQDGSLYFFHANSFSPDTGIRYFMARSNADGSQITNLRIESYSLSEALWAPDASFALIVEPTDSNWRLLMLPADASPLTVLFDADWIQNLAWGP
jgi:hypothetical protein